MFYSQICEDLHCSSLDSIPSSKSSDCRNYILPGFNDYVKDLHSVTRSDYVVCRDAGKSRSGTPCSNMRHSRLQFKYALQQCRMNEDVIRADKYAKSFIDKDIVSFWKHIRTSNNARVPLTTTIGDATGEDEIAENCQDHYKSILNSVKTNSRQQFVTIKLSSIRGESILFSTSDINPVYTCLLDTSKAFNLVNHWTLFAKLIETDAPLLIMRVLLFWYQKQQVCIK